MFRDSKKFKEKEVAIENVYSFTNLGLIFRRLPNFKEVFPNSLKVAE